MTFKRHLFALFRAQGSTISQAYVSAGYKGGRISASKNGSKLAANQEIKALISELEASETPEQIRAKILELKAGMHDKKAVQRNRALNEIAAQRDKEISLGDAAKQRPAPFSVHDVRALESCIRMVVLASAAIAEEVQKLGGDPLVFSAALATHRAASSAQVEWMQRLRQADSAASIRGASERLSVGSALNLKAAIHRLEGNK